VPKPKRPAFIGLAEAATTGPGVEPAPDSPNLEGERDMVLRSLRTAEPTSTCRPCVGDGSVSVLPLLEYTISSGHQPATSTRRISRQADGAALNRLRQLNSRKSCVQSTSWLDSDGEIRVSCRVVRGKDIAEPVASTREPGTEYGRDNGWRRGKSEK
jgi:hypothetical protein